MITKPLTREEHYMRLAIDFKGQARLRRCDAAVHVEAAQDQRFWDTIFHHFIPDHKFHFIFHSRTPRGSMASGVTQCLNFRPYLSKDFFICIDSDYRYLLQEPGIAVGNYIFQTYTYAIENHYCAAPGLDFVCERATGEKNEIFNFDVFLKRYSETIFELFLWYIHAHITAEFQFDRWDFYQIIGLRRNGHYPDIKNNGEAELDYLNESVQSKLRSLMHSHPLVDIEPTRKRMNDLGVRPDNVYLFVRGHNLFDSVVSVGRKVCEKLLENKKTGHNGENHHIADAFSNGHDFANHVKHNFSFGKYTEIVKIEKDVHSLFGMDELP
ncbi:MAG: DUF4435 domain-containing protein [Bacteroidota bacterium]|nr:DUF4435 domain-containing protein [Bacteroidota bacterium]